MSSKSFAINHINWPVESASDEPLEADVIVDRYVSLGVDLNHDIRIAIGPIIASRPRSEQCGVRYASRSQSALVLSKCVQFS